MESPSTPRPLLQAARWYLVGTPDCLMFLTTVPGTAHPAVPVCSNHRRPPTPQSPPANLHPVTRKEERSVQVTSLPTTQATGEGCKKKTWPCLGYAHVLTHTLPLTKKQRKVSYESTFRRYHHPNQCSSSSVTFSCYSTLLTLCALNQN